MHIFETDCKALVDQLCREHTNITERGVLLNQIRQMLVSDADFKVQFVGRKAKKKWPTL
ncbi:hypothetical protein JHK87_018018 [Glycine soja]|nr:hypothetical protein JHK87_018018 [Glycine soja]